MTSARTSGLLLLLGSMGGLATIAMHPHGDVSTDQYQHLALVSAAVHSLAIASFIALFIGCIDLTIRLNGLERDRTGSRLALPALAVFAFAIVAILIAATVSGFVVPRSMIIMSHQDASAEPQWRSIISVLYQVNQGFARVYVMLAWIAVGLWSLAALRSRGLGQRVSIYGCIAAVLLVLLTVVGHIRLDVHGMGLVGLAQSLWFGIVGFQIYKSAGVPTVCS